MQVFTHKRFQTLIHMLVHFKQIRHFVSNKLGCSDRRMSMMTWAELLHKVVLVQQTTRLCIARCDACMCVLQAAIYSTMAKG